MDRKYVAEKVLELANRGQSMITAGSFSVIAPVDECNTLFSLAQQYGMITRGSAGQCTIRSTYQLQDELKEEVEIGDEVVVVRDGRKYPAMVKSEPDDKKVSLSFGDDAPEEHEDESEYEEDELGEE